MTKLNSLTLVVLFVLLVLFSSFASADYFMEVYMILQKTDEDMEEFGRLVERATNNNISSHNFYLETENLKDNSFENLKTITSLENDFLSKDTHTELISIVNSWYISLDLMYLGINEDNMDKFEASMEVMKYLKQKMKDINLTLK